MTTNTEPVSMDWDTRLAAYRVSINDETIGLVWLGANGWFYSDQPDLGTVYATKEDAAQLLVYAYWKAQKQDHIGNVTTIGDQSCH